jgi:hypothetical protein
MSGQIRLKGNWHPFTADQVTHWGKGFVWRARVSVRGLPVSGFDKWINGVGRMRWKLLGLVPVMTASGPDVSRSARERMLIELIWLPSAFLSPNVTLKERDSTRAEVGIRQEGQETRYELSLDENGRLRGVSMLRWGDPEGRGFSALPFGSTAEEERTFGGFTIPSKLRAGWYFGTDRFETDGEFFRCTIEEAVYR